jgi:CHAT domain-containing protein
MDYVVSSYSTSLTALSKAQKHTKSFTGKSIRLGVVAEPNAPGMNSIPKVKDEAAVISSLVNGVGSGHVNTFTRLCEFTKVAEVESMLASVDFVHFACHGEQKPVDPLNSAFLLGNGSLTIERLMDLPRCNMSFALLSACDTSMGDAQLPDQVLHLAGAMSHMGVLNIIATLW